MPALSEQYSINNCSLKEPTKYEVQKQSMFKSHELLYIFLTDLGSENSGPQTLWPDVLLVYMHTTGSPTTDR